MKDIHTNTLLMLHEAIKIAAEKDKINGEYGFNRQSDWKSCNSDIEEELEKRRVEFTKNIL